MGYRRARKRLERVVDAMGDGAYVPQALAERAGVSLVDVCAIVVLCEQVHLFRSFIDDYERRLYYLTTEEGPYRVEDYVTSSTFAHRLESDVLTRGWRATYLRSERRPGWPRE